MGTLTTGNQQNEMNGWSSRGIDDIVERTFVDFRSHVETFRRMTRDSLTETLDYLRSLANQFPLLIAATPSATRGRRINRIETIPEDDDEAQPPRGSDEKAPQIRTRSRASKRTCVVVKRQQTRLARAAKTRKSRSSSEEEEEQGGNDSKRVKREQSQPRKRAKRNEAKLDAPPENSEKNRQLAAKRNSKPDDDDSQVVSTSSDTLEASLYEDAVAETSPSFYSTVNRPSYEETSRRSAADSTFVVEKNGPAEARACRTLRVSLEELMTDDESTPEVERKRRKPGRAKRVAGGRRRIIRSSTSSEAEAARRPAVAGQKRIVARDPSSEEEIPCTPEARNARRNAILFSPYAMASVRRRVEAFEKVGAASSPRVGTPEVKRVTRTKTRALAAAATADGATGEIGTGEESRGAVPPSRDESLQSQQKRATPVGGGRARPLSRIPLTPTFARFLSKRPVTIRGTGSIDGTDGKKRRVNEEDKRGKAAQVGAEEKKRKREEQQRKTKLAREAKERREVEKRAKAEQERKEKERLAALQEEQRQEAERKRLAQLREIEEKRLREEQQRLREREEQERKRKEEQERKRKEEQERKRKEEQEVERRRLAEARAQQQAAAAAAAAEAARAKAKKKQQMPSAKKPPAVTNYVIDNDPDDEDSDDEARPKYEIPTWAKLNVRRAHLAMQRHVPTAAIQRFFRSQACTPDLTVMFVGIDPRRLKRTSSAIWKPPPRCFSMTGGLATPSQRDDGVF